MVWGVFPLFLETPILWKCQIQNTWRVLCDLWKLFLDSKKARDKGMLHWNRDLFLVLWFDDLWHLSVYQSTLLWRPTVLLLSILWWFLVIPNIPQPYPQPYNKTMSKAPGRSNKRNIPVLSFPRDLRQGAGRNGGHGRFALPNLGNGTQLMERSCEVHFNPYILGLPPTQDASHKWRFRLGFPIKNVIILVVTVTGWGVDLNDNKDPCNSFWNSPHITG